MTIKDMALESSLQFWARHGESGALPFDRIDSQSVQFSIPRVYG